MRQNLGVAASGSDPTQYATIGALSNYVLKTAIPWCPEMVCTSAAVADGYNDMPGGISVEPGPGTTGGVIITAIYVRVGTIGSSITGGSLGVDVYAGTATTQGTNIASFSLATTTTSLVTTISATTVAANAVVRVYFTKGSCTTTAPIHVQLRGRYNT